MTILLKTLVAAVFMLAWAEVPAATNTDSPRAAKKSRAPQTLKQIRKLASEGDAAAQYKLGTLYASGKGVKRNDGEALAWFRLAAAQNHAEAAYSIGRMYDEGYAVPQDFQTAAEWYMKAADNGHTLAQYNLGLMHLEGHGVPNDFVQAHMWFNLASAKGHAEAIKNRKWSESRMSAWQRAEAQSMAREWQARH